jgi:hypothetical protein
VKQKRRKLKTNIKIYYKHINNICITINKFLKDAEKKDFILFNLKNFNNLNFKF